VNTVHDSVLLDVPREEIHDVAKICVDAMENLKKHKKKYFPEIDFSWLTCPLRVDIGIGTHYGIEMKITDWISLYG
jgi:DNA polymerase I-like protein with 3'-5' exonuclease and polymerase domains